MTFTCPQCGARNSQFQDCGCEEVPDELEAGDAELEEADHWCALQKEER